MSNLGGFKSVRTVLSKEQISSRAQEIVNREVGKIPGRRGKGKPGTITICCPFHHDSNPSCVLNVAPTEKFPTGFYFCYSCGAKGNWNKLAERLGLETIKESDHKDSRSKVIDKDKLRGNLLTTDRNRTLEDLLEEEKMAITMPFPSERVWRHIKGKLLNKIGALVTVDERTNKQVVILPVVVQEDAVGFIKAAWRKDKRKAKGKANPSYVNSHGTWTRTRGLFPFDLAIETMRRKRMKTLVLVEGPRDALFLLQKGIPAVSILGVTNWTKKKVNTILAEGVGRIIVCMDGDKAGVQATNQVYRDCKRLAKTKIVRMTEWLAEINKRREKKGRAPTDKLDPATLPLKYRHRLRKMLK